MICLLRPPAVESFRFATGNIAPPLGLAYIAAAVEGAGHQVTVIDAVGEGPETLTGYYKGFLVGLRLEELAARIPQDAQALGITVIFTHEWPAVVRLIELIKRRRPDLPIILGGEHVTAMPDFSLATSQADYLVLGEGEETIVELLAALNGVRPIDSVDGVAYRRGSVIVIRPRRQRRRSIDDIAVPAWHHIDLAAYRRYRLVGGTYSDARTVPVLATRGCPYQCTYCSAPNMWTPRWVARDPVRVVDEIEAHIAEHGAGSFPLQDLTAILRKDWIVTFCREILERRLRISWQLPTGTRAEAIDAEVAMLLRQSGLSTLAYAPESGSAHTRRLIKKKLKATRLLASIGAAVAAGLNVSVFLVIGFPHDEPKHLRDNLGLIDRLNELGVTDLPVGYYMALPGTELFHSQWDAGQIRLDRAYFRHILDSLALVPSRSYCPQLDRRALLAWKLRLFTRFYGARRRAGGPSLSTTLRRALGGSSHQTKLETALRNAFRSAVATASSHAGPRWLSRADERQLFADWDRTYRVLRARRLAEDGALATPVDSRKIHQTNVSHVLAADHGRAWRFDLAELL
ncbi:MAG: B12-binding domain-containing radical SAM protein [Deltaproteobacteria bacterium]|nr:B12-binding domain-containing radical SAM protein [Deltaproteobacteria bacterium]